MLSVRKHSWMMAFGVAGLLGSAMASPTQAASAVRWGEFSASSTDRLTGASIEAGNTYVLKSSSISIGDIETLQAAQKRSESELQSLKTKVDGQDRAFDEFKRKDGSSSSSSDSQLSSLKRTVDEQKNTIDRQKGEIDGLKRSLDDLKRSVETLSNKVK
ncbi:hypothetical protein SAMN05216475_2093 [Pseudomonas synxantha]|uniref:Uncharacterized protein n=1 Tax=Pseudomonas synxantha TaxID=47883 RepID=A0AAX3I669_9PSED|nr:hypothetical protein [Pseudomonas synxantha]AZE67269.1 hypothetical protein C4K01_3074 [Pseudomonas synxantha]KRP52369.1 hypothetical protein TU77_18545 [Pseudomonas synxantha]MDQ0981318.1 hypothetical protein [Pseudomonas synxantha]SDU27298.1 hypothetical protein SAMN05216475_2093 [Pseudomonas synxantha]VTQ99193.1 Uncharacterised protein [Pseudomonas synxantha]